MTDDSNLKLGIVKLTWQERAVQTAKYHANRCRSDPNHRLEDTASELGRSLGRVSEDLTLANWMKTHSRVEKFRNPTQALDWIKQKKKEMKLEV